MSLVISRTPFRISFFGGGTDYPAWYRKEGGAVLSASIDKYCYITCRFLPPFFPSSYRVVWKHIETVSSISEILHPAVRGALRMLGFDKERGVEILYQGDLPSQTGMGSSSAFAVGLINVLSALKGDHFGADELYAKAIELEQNWLKENVGSQDQVATAVGGLNIIRFSKSGAIAVEPLGLDPERCAALTRRLVLFYTGQSRLGGELASSLIAGMDRHAEQLHRMHHMVFEAAAILRSDRNLDEFGRLLNEAWQLKRALAEGITNPEIDSIYRRAIAAGAVGGKLLGAGSSGFMLFYVPEERRSAVNEALSTLMPVPFEFEHEGSTLILNSYDRGPGVTHQKG
jgi:D-glycero-alpha-D-manno-heptose-7-phosphate kinase